jgi:hypothetical protein
LPYTPLNKERRFIPLRLDDFPVNTEKLEKHLELLRRYDAI